MAAVVANDVEPYSIRFAGNGVDESRFMNDFPDEHHYAWRLIRVARQVHSGSAAAQDDIIALLDQALDAGLDRTTLIVELAEIGGRLLALCDPTAADEICLTS